MISPFTIEGSIVSNVSHVCETKEDKFKYFVHILPAESILDQRHKDVREQRVQWVAAETSLVFICDAEKRRHL